VGRRLHVLHLRLPAGIRLRQLCGAKAAPAQRRLPARRESRNTGKLNNHLIRFTPGSPDPKKANFVCILKAIKYEFYMSVQSQQKTKKNRYIPIKNKQTKQMK